MLTSDEVRHIAQLAKVGVTDAEVEQLREQLSNILEHFSALSQIDTESIPPTGHAVPLHNVFRDDVAEPSYSTEEILANAPRQEERSIRVRAVLEF